MTIAVSLKVADGLVLAADSASTFNGSDGRPETVYNNANKITNLVKGLPIGLLVWGLGSIGGRSLGNLAKDLRRSLSTEGDPAYVDPGNYTVQEVAEKVKTFFYDDHYAPEAAAHADPGAFPSMGLLVAGYSSDNHHAEDWVLDLSPAGCTGPEVARGAADTGVVWAGQPESISRLVNGFSPALADVLVTEFGVLPSDIPNVLQLLNQKLGAPLVNPAMPFQDAIDLAEWLVGIAIGYARFMPGAPTVGGPIEVAAITEHEGFKWVHRKHYYDPRLNP